MGTIFEKAKPEWVDEIYQIELTDPVVGGSEGIANKQAKQLAERTQFLKKQVEKSISQSSVNLSNIEDLRSYTDISSHIVIVSSYANGLGGGVFVLDTNDRTSLDDGGLVIVSAGGARWKRLINGNTLTLADFGAFPNGVECGARIQAAFDACAGKYDLIADSGTYLTARELKTPSGLRFKGAGMYQTIIKADVRLPAIANVMTNKSNNYLVRAIADENIHLSDFTINADWRGRYSIGASIQNQACGLKWSAVRLSSATNVRVINAALHCFDICADQYFDNGDVTATAATPSEYITLTGCVAENPYRDDAFTTHNSRHITFNDCVALFDGSVSALGNTQQGFEADEGSANVVFKRCYAKGFHCGYQSKGHSTTKPAENITFDDCEADFCAYGGMASVGHNPTGKAGYTPQSVTFRNFIVSNPQGNKHLSNPTALLIYGADGVMVDGLTINGSANVIVEQGAGFVNMRNVIFKSALRDVYGGLIELRATLTGSAVINIDNLSVKVAQSIPTVYKPSDRVRLVLHNAYIAGNGAFETAALKIKRNARDKVSGLWSSCKYTVELLDEGVKLTGDVQLDAFKRIMMTGNPVVGDRPLSAPIGTVIISQWGEQWTQRSVNAEEPNWVKFVN